MGVDSGLPDFRGNEGMWQAYPALGRARLDFTEIANPQALPMTRNWPGAFMVTACSCTATPCRTPVLRYCNNGPAPCHTALLCLPAMSMASSSAPVSIRIASLNATAPFITCNAAAAAMISGRPMPSRQPLMHNSAGCYRHCPAARTAALARPNILMFDDWHWLEQRTEAQQRRYRQWRAQSARHY